MRVRPGSISFHGRKAHLCDPITHSVFAEIPHNTSYYTYMKATGWHVVFISLTSQLRIENMFEKTGELVGPLKGNYLSLLLLL